MFLQAKLKGRQARSVTEGKDRQTEKMKETLTALTQCFNVVEMGKVVTQNKRKHDKKKLTTAKGTTGN